MKRILIWPYQLYVWLLLLPFVGVFTLLCGWLTVTVAMVAGPRRASRYVAANWARVVAWMTPMIVRVEGAENVDPRGTYVVTSNHVSQYDILALYGWLRLDLKWVMKKELRKIPGIGIGCEKVGHIFIDRGNPEAAKKIINTALEGLGDGVGILMFPEGTRSRDGHLLPFKKGAFRIAKDLGLPILPVTLLGTRDILPAKTLMPYPGRATLVIHPPIDPRGRDLRSLMDATREAIGSALPDAWHDNDAHR